MISARSSGTRSEAVSLERLADQPMQPEKTIIEESWTKTLENNLLLASFD